MDQQHDETISVEMRQSTRQLFCKFNDEEKLALADNITAKRKEIDFIESQKKRISGLHEEISELSSEYRRGGETRYVECTTYYDTPSEGKKTIVRNDTQETVLVENMTHDELQGNLPFDGELDGNDQDGDDDAAGEDLTVPTNGESDDEKVYPMAAASRTDGEAED